MVANLLIQKTWFHFTGMWVEFTTDDVVMHTASVIQCFASYCACCVHWSHWVDFTSLALWSFLSWWLLRFRCLQSVIVRHVVIWHPVHGTLMVLRVSRSGHHLVIYLLLWSCVRWGLVTHVVSLIPRQIFGFDFCTVKFAILWELLGKESMSCTSSWYAILLNLVLFNFISIQNRIHLLVCCTYINIFNGIMAHECGERA